MSTSQHQQSKDILCRPVGHQQYLSPEMKKKKEKTSSALTHIWEQKNLPDLIELIYVIKHSLYVILRQIHIKINHSFYSHLQTKVTEAAVKNAGQLILYNR